MKGNYSIPSLVELGRNVLDPELIIPLAAEVIIIYFIYDLLLKPKPAETRQSIPFLPILDLASLRNKMNISFEHIREDTNTWLALGRKTV